MAQGEYRTKEQVLERAERILHKSLREIIPEENIAEIEAEIAQYRNRRKGLLGELVERFVFEIDANSRPEPDFSIARIELKTNPLKRHPKKTYVSKERLVFSMINYDEIVREIWEESSFLRKNRVLLILFYLWAKEKSLLDYEFKFSKLIDLLEDISAEDVLQIRRDWEYIVEKIRRGEAHLLSEGDTYYLGACTKAANNKVVRDQPLSRAPAKPRAFSFKQQYLNYIIQRELLGNKGASTDSIFNKLRRVETVEEAFREKFAPYIGKTDSEIRRLIGWNDETSAKNYKRLLVNRMLGVSSNKIEELEKANIVLKVITLEANGKLRESLSFPAFDYKEIVDQPWYDEDGETMADFHLLLETQKFLFVVFQKAVSENIILKKIQFWNFPMADIEEARRVWQRTVDCISEGRYDALPKMSESRIAHVRPHGRDSSDTLETPQGTWEMKRCFWLNARYIQSQLGL